MYKKYNVVYFEDAKQDISKLISFYEETAGHASSENFEKLVKKIIDSLSVNPELHRIFDYDEFGKNIRRAIIPNKKARIIYRIDHEKMVVIAVLAYHTSQNPSSYRRVLHSRLDDDY